MTAPRFRSRVALAGLVLAATVTVAGCGDPAPPKMDGTPNTAKTGEKAPLSPEAPPK